MRDDIILRNVAELKEFLQVLDDDTLLFISSASGVSKRTA